MLKDILSISGQPGLFKFISQGKSGIIVESLLDKKRMNAFATNKMSSLEDISIFTEDDEVSLGEVLKIIKEKQNGEAAISHKSSGEELKSFFEDVLPNYDKERVYVSDIKKVVNWYNTLQKADMLDFEEEEEKTEEKDQVEEEGKPAKENPADSSE